MNKDHFPIFKNNPRLVYLDSAATAQVPQVVIDAMNDYYTGYKANVHRGIYNISEKATDEYEKSRKIVAGFINAESEEIVFTGGLTEAMNFLANSLSIEVTEGDTIITTVEEHHSSFLPFQRLAMQKKASLKFVDIKEDFTLDVESYKRLLDENRVKFVVVSGLSNVTGYITPIKELTKFAHEKDAKVVVDAAQMIPHLQTDVKDLDVDYLVFAGHKVYGPTGIGVLYGKKELLENLEPLKVGGGMIKLVGKDESTWGVLPERHEAGTPNIAGAIGLAAAINYLEDIGMDNIEHQEKELTEYAIKKLNEVPGIKVFTPSDASLRTSVLSIHLDKAHAHDIADILDRYKVAVRAGHHCAQILMREYLKVEATARISMGLYNDEADIDKLVEALQEVVRIFK